MSPINIAATVYIAAGIGTFMFTLHAYLASKPYTDHDSRDRCLLVVSFLAWPLIVVSWIMAIRACTANQASASFTPNPDNPQPDTTTPQEPPT